MSPKEAAEALLCAVEDSGHKADVMAACEALRAALAEAETCKDGLQAQATEAEAVVNQQFMTEPVAWALAYREEPDDYDHFTTVASTMKRWVEDEDNIAVPLYTQPPEPVESADELIAMARQADALHAAISQAVALLNRFPGISHEVYEAHGRLRTALSDYADAMQEQER